MKRLGIFWASQVALVVKNLPANAGDVRDTGLVPGSGRSPGEGHGNPFQYSSLENPMDRGAWWATVHRVAQSRTQLKINLARAFSGPHFVQLFDLCHLYPNHSLIIAVGIISNSERLSNLLLVSLAVSMYIWSYFWMFLASNSVLSLVGTYWHLLYVKYSSKS